MLYRFGVVQILIANHGIEVSDDKPIDEMSLDQFKNTLDINLTGTFLFAREVLEFLEFSWN